MVNNIDKGIPVGLKLDCYHLEYFTNKIHFAGHYVAIYGYDNEYAYLIDTQQQGGKVKTSLKSLELARNEKGPMSSKNSKDIARDFKTTAMLMERAGTGGALFRNLYRDFLKESADLLKSEQIHEAFLGFSKIAGLWTEVSSLFDKAGETKKEKFINRASDILVDLSGKEKKAMELLVNI